MARRRLLWRIYPAFLLCILLCVLGVGASAAYLVGNARAMRSVYIGLGLSALGMAVLAGALAMLVSRRVARRIEHIREGAEGFAAGQLRHRLLPQDTDEFSGLAEALNSMAAQLQDKIAYLERYRTLQETVLSTMAEGVLALNLDERIISMNAAAGRLLGADPQAAQGKRLQEFCRSPALGKLVRGAFLSGQTAQGQIILRDEGGEHCLQGRASLLQPSGAECVGVLLVLADLTHLRQLENVRRDFVANVSHELKTPITSIKGFVETLREGAKDEPAKASRFLEIIARQADRLDAIIEDLLSLSRLERAGDHEPIDRPTTLLRPVMEAAMADVQEKARQKKVQLAMDCPPQVQGPLNQRLLEQALVNLLDNAVKYSPDGGKVELSAKLEGGKLTLQVRDYGCGIEPQYLGRIFERFYRVDKARSREVGGTGLGLAIVKHIAQAHGGGVSVQSAPGAGSTFTITLPAT